MNTTPSTPPVVQQRMVRLGSYGASFYNAEEILPLCARNAERQPCPFCGDRSTGYTHNEGYQVILCLNCGAMGPQMRDATEDWNEADHKTLALWNARVPPEVAEDWHEQSKKPNVKDEGRRTLGLENTNSNL